MPRPISTASSTQSVPLEDVERSSLLLPVGIAAAMVAVKLYGGITAESKALLMSAMLSLLAGLSVVGLELEASAARRAKRRRLRRDSSKHEIVVAGAMSLVVILGVVGLCGSLVHDLIHHRQHAPCATGWWYALVGTVGPLVVLYLATVSAGRDPWTADSALRHWQMDLLGSLVVTVTLVATRSEGLLFLDSLVAMCCAAYATSASSVALRRAIEGLMDASVGEEETTLIRSTIEAVDGVFEVSRVVAIRCGRATHVTASISLARSTPMAEAGRIRDHIALAVERQTGDVTEVLVAFEPRDTGARRLETERGRP